jgi:hypothetical protein
MPPHLRNTRLAQAKRPIECIEECDPSTVSLQRYQRNLDRHTAAGKIMTFNPQYRRWERWPRYGSVLSALLRPDHHYRPYFQSKEGLLGNMHADLFPLVPSPKPVLCPHSLNPLRRTEDCTMTVHKKSRGAPTFYFQVSNKTHHCSFQSEFTFVLNNTNLTPASTDS